MKILSVIAIFLVAFAKANHTETQTEPAVVTTAEDTVLKLILSSLVKGGDDPQHAACMAFVLRYSGTIEQNKNVINESNVDQVVKMIKEESTIAHALCTYGLTALAIGFAISAVLLIVCCCACCCFTAQLCCPNNRAVISGSKKALRNNGLGDKVEMYVPRARKQYTDV